MRRSTRTTAAIACLTTLVLGGGGAAPADKDSEEKTAKVTGTIEFKGEVELGPDTVAVVQLLDVSLADAPAKKLGEQTIKDPKNFPIPFAVAYDPKAVVVKGRRYTVSVRISTGGRLDFINDTAVPVISNGRPTKDVKLPVIRVRKP